MARLNTSDWSACDEFKEDIALMRDGKIVKPQRIKPLTRAKNEEINQVKTNLKAQLPVLTAIGLRRSRVPYHEAVVLELEESGMLDAANYMKRLFLLDQNKILESQRNLVDYLKNRLIAVEVSKRTEKQQDQVRILLNTAMFFKALTCDWFWITDELLKEALDIAERITTDRGQMLNGTKFIYGKFLLDDVKNIRESEKLFEQVREASKDKRWNVSKLLKIKEENLFRESNVFLYKILLMQSEELRKSDTKMAVNVSLQALKYAQNSEYEEYVAKALQDLGRSQMAAGNIQDALKSFTKFLAKVKRIPDANGVCDALKELAFTHEALKDNDGTLKYLHLFRECADKSNLSVKLAEAHFYTGNYLLHQNQPSDGSLHLKMAFDQFKSLNMREEMDRSRFLLGVSKGEEVMEEFMGLILRCGNKDVEATMKLLQWKNKRIPFWTQSCEQNEDMTRNHSQNFPDESTDNEN